MTEKLRLHNFTPQKGNPFACEECPYLRGNPVHRKAPNQQGQVIRGTASPNKTA